MFNVSGEVLSVVKFLTHDWTITVEESKDKKCVEVLSFLKTRHSEK